MKELEGKVAFVTGAASGIGLGIVEALAQAGVKVMMCDIEKAPLEEALGGCKTIQQTSDFKLAMGLFIIRILWSCAFVHLTACTVYRR